ncbi:XdhC family protein [Tsuneonella mangrovi]|uniref:XdhC family protein n=1 Tax=Tsuneonella mangrovi TaxID=1982042 RepID=UPI000BA27355|nr:XdhC family protein [Tsuneonella mangrovi]
MTVPSDHAALAAVAESGGGLCTIVGIDGAFSRRIGAQLAVLPDGTLTGSLADGCLEHQLASDVAAMREPEVRRYGQGSPLIDFRLPCGGGLDILLDPAPDQAACRAAMEALSTRRPAMLELPTNSVLARRRYIPGLAIDAIGDGPELAALVQVARAAGIAVRVVAKNTLALGAAPPIAPPDRWTATVLLFHDHEWEAAILRHALQGDGFYIGAQGGFVAREARAARLLAEGIEESQLARIRGPIGCIDSCRDPETLALSVLAEIAGEYDKLHAEPA